MTTGYGIFSGGLDSMLSALVLVKQGVRVRLITFVSPFFGAEKAVASARDLGLNIRTEMLGQPYLDMIRSPRHGYGRFANPCIDCHAMMFARAGEIMTVEGGDFLFSGEVLGQRPKSQNRRALDMVARDSGYPERILRPLSALALPETDMEKSGQVDRGGLHGFSGRTRKPQMALAREFGLTDYPSPAGGCLLTDPAFSRRLKELMEKKPGLQAADAEIMKYGRQFRLPDGPKLVVGRNHMENETLEGLAGPEDLLFKAEDVPGPVVLMPDGLGVSDRDMETAADVTLAYGDLPDGHVGSVRVTGALGERTLTAEARPKAEFAHLMI